MEIEKLENPETEKTRLKLNKLKEKIDEMRFNKMLDFTIENVKPEKGRLDIQALPKFTEEEIKQNKKLKTNAEEDNKKTDLQLIIERNSFETIKDFEFLLIKHASLLKKEQRLEYVKSLTDSGFKIKTDNKTGEINDIYLKKLNLDIKTFDRLQPYLEEGQIENIKTDALIFESKYRKRYILEKVISTEEGAKAFQEGELTESKVMTIAEKMAKEGDTEMQWLIMTSNRTDQEIEKTAKREIEEDLEKTRKSSPENITLLKKIFKNNEEAKFNLLYELYQQNISLAECGIENGRLYFKAPAIRFTPKTVFITAKGLEAQNKLFNFDQIDDIIKGLSGQDELANENDERIKAIVEKAERKNWIKEIWTCSKVYEIANHLPKLIANQHSSLIKLTPEERFRVLIGILAQSKAGLFRDFQEAVNNVNALDEIPYNPEIKFILNKIFT